MLVEVDGEALDGAVPAQTFALRPRVGARSDPAQRLGRVGDRGDPNGEPSSRGGESEHAGLLELGGVRGGERVVRVLLRSQIGEATLTAFDGALG
ncbi:MAG: hypothetical protein HYX34_03890 [Actinobacteria bacterium]|nr:hypothetical protein [Actinomycetota bacterium]